MEDDPLKDLLGEGFDLEDLDDLGMDLGSIAASDFDDRGAVDPQAYIVPARCKIVHPRCVSYASAQKVAATLFPLQRGAKAHVVVPGTFLYGDLFEAIAVHLDAKIQELWIMTLSLNMANVESLKNLQAGDYVGDLHLMVSDYWYASERGEDALVQAVYDELDNGKFQMSVVRSHGKVALMEMNTGEFYVVVGSANLRSTSTIENFTVENDRPLYDWYKRWISELENQFFTVNGDKGIHAQRCARKKDQWRILEDLRHITPGGEGLPMRVQRDPQNTRETVESNSSAGEHPSNVRR